MYGKNLDDRLTPARIRCRPSNVSADLAVARRQRTSTALGLVLRTAMWTGTAIAIAAPAAANPAGGSVVAGTATITQKANLTQINQSSGSAVINWQSFNIAPGETTVFRQPSATSVLSLIHI